MLGKNSHKMKIEDDDWTIEVTIPIRNIDGDNANGEVKVVLNTPDSGAKYLRDPNINKYEASVTINDTDIPRVSIANAPETVEGQYAEFELTSHIEPHKAIDIHFTPRASTGNFLDLTGGLDNRPRTTTEPLTFRSEGAGKPYKAILQVLTTDDENLTNGEISVILLDDQSPKDYTRDGNDSANTATARVIDPPNPTLTIAYNGNAVTEGEMATFTITASENPKRPLKIKYTPTDVALTPTDTVINYLDTTLGTTGTERDPVTLNFTDPDGTDTWTSELTIDTRTPDGEDANHGKITVELKPNANDVYTVTDQATKSAEVTVHDFDVPEITIENAPAVVAGIDAVFKLTADIQPWQDLDIKYIPNNVTGEFLNPTPTATGVERIAEDLTFARESAGKPIEVTFPIATIADGTLNSGSFSVTLQDDTNTVKNYKLSTETAKRTGTVTVDVTPIPELSIANATTVSEGTAATFTITATKNPRRSMSIRITPSETGTNFLDTTAGDSGEIRNLTNINFTQADSSAPWTVDIEIPMRAQDNKDSDHGTITITINDPVANTATVADDYTVAASPANVASVTVQDLDVPTITIESAKETLAGNKAKFKLTAHIQPWQDLDIKYIPRNITAEFLDPTPTATGIERMANDLTFAAESQGQPITAILEVATIDDPLAEAGEIEVTLVDDTTNTPQHYTISETVAQTKNTVDVIDVPNPTLSITYKGDADTPITEGQTATFVIEASENPKRPLDIRYTPSNNSPGGEFLDTSNNVGNSGVPRTATQKTFTQLNDTAPWLAEIEIETNVNTADQLHGGITVVINTAPLANNPYTVATAPGNSASVKVNDAHAPVITISNAAEVSAGTAAQFRLVASIQPAQASIDIRFKPTNEMGAFLKDYTHDAIASEPVEFTSSGAGQPFVGTLPIPTMEDASNNTGTIMITLVADDTDPPDYTIDTTEDTTTDPSTFKHKAKVDITDFPTPTLSIAAKSGTVTEGDRTVKFIVTSSTEPENKSFNVDITPNHTGSYLNTSENAGTARMEPMTFSQSNGTDWTFELSLDLRVADGIDAANGSVTVTLNPVGQNSTYVGCSFSRQCRNENDC